MINEELHYLRLKEKIRANDDQLSGIEWVRLIKTMVKRLDRIRY